MPTVRGLRQECTNETKHELLIRELVASDPRMCRNQFWQAMNALADEFEFSPDDWQVVREFRPDAYLIDRERQVIQIYEVEVTCPLSEKKLDDYAWLWFVLEAEGQCDWLPELYTVDRYGNRNALDLCSLYYERCIGKHVPA